MHDFQVKFFPQIASKSQHYEKETDYCRYSNHWLQTFTSSLYLAALVSTYLASWVTDKHGRKLTMALGGAVSLAGAALTAGAQNLAMIILGRTLMGFAIGFANQASATKRSALSHESHALLTIRTIYVLGSP
jgi:MFS family permease